MLWSQYIHFLNKRPLLTKVMTGSVLYSSGDIITQKLEKQKEWNRKRTFAMCIYGGFWLSPFLHHWYKLIVNFSLLKKIMIDQSIVAPINLFMYQTINIVCSMKSLSNESNYFHTLVKLWMFWIPVQMINFKYIPLQGRVLFVNVAGMSWSIILSHSMNRNQ